MPRRVYTSAPEAEAGGAGAARALAADAVAEVARNFLRLVVVDIGSYKS
jgi:hypothetical protein